MRKHAGRRKASFATPGDHRLYPHCPSGRRTSKGRLAAPGAAPRRPEHASVNDEMARTVRGRVRHARLAIDAVDVDNMWLVATGSRRPADAAA